MKTLSIIFLALVASTAWAQQATSMGNSKVNVDFTKYKSFTWAKSDPTAVGPNGYDIYYYEYEADNNKGAKGNKNNKTKAKSRKDSPAYIYSYSVIIPAKDASANGAIQDAISNELEGRGYRENSTTGDLIVSYQVLDRKASLRGYNNDYPEQASGKEVRQPSDTTTFALEPGTLLVSLIDAKTSEVVWDGFSSGMIKENNFVVDEVELKEAIHMIFEKFKYTADKASKN